MTFPLITRISADWMLQNPRPSARPELPNLSMLSSCVHFLTRRSRRAEWRAQNGRQWTKIAKAFFPVRSGSTSVTQCLRVLFSCVHVPSVDLETANRR
jgi:hypothetical protein